MPLDGAAHVIRGDGSVCPDKAEITFDRSAIEGDNEISGQRTSTNESVDSSSRTDLHRNQFGRAFGGTFQKIQQQIDGMGKDVQQLQIVGERRSAARIVLHRTKREITL